MKPNPEFTQIKIRIPANLRNQLKAESSVQKRSMNAQVNFILSQFIQSSLTEKMQD